MPVPFFNVLNGGDHSGNTMAFQEFMIAPTGAGSLTEAVQLAAETYLELKNVIIKKHGKSAIGIGDEGGFAPPISDPREALDLLMEAIDNAGHTGKIEIGIDPASQSFFIGAPLPCKSCRNLSLPAFKVPDRTARGSLRPRRLASMDGVPEGLQSRAGW